MTSSLPGFDIVGELYLNGDWVPATIRTADDITITRGRRDEASTPEPSSAGLTLDNRSGNYSLRNPNGAYFGSINRNTPLRLARNLARDTFTRTVVNEWGAMETGQDYALFGAGGSVLFSDFQVAAGVGTLSLPVANSFRRVLISSLSFEDLDITATFALPFSDVTGGAVDAGITFREQGSPGALYYAELVVTAAEAVQVQVFHSVDGVLTGPVTVSGLTHTSTQRLRMRAQTEGHTIRLKVWAETAKEPYGWHLTLHDERITTAGFPGIRCGVSSSNTNTKPVVWSVDNVVVRSMRTSVEVVNWPQRWDLSGNDVYVPIEAAGIRRRLSRGASALSSTLYRGIITAVPAAVAYWPCEDGKTATSIASGVGGPAMSVVGTTDFASYDSIPASHPLPTLKAGTWDSVGIPVYTPPSPNVIQMRFVMHAPAAGSELPNNSIMIDIHNTGSAGLWRILYGTGGTLKVQCWSNASSGSADVLDTGFLGYDVRDRKFLVFLTLTQSGSNVTWRIELLEVGSSTGLFFTGTVTTKTIGLASRVVVDPLRVCDGLSIGHIVITLSTLNVFDLFDELNAFTGERAGVRIQRLCAQQGIAFSYYGDLNNTIAMGPQRPLPLLALLDECADVDMGTLGESRGELGLVYRTLQSLYNQAPAITLDYQGGQVSAPFEPVDDDRQVYNDVTVSRVNAGSARAFLDKGPLSVLDPHNGGVGRYELPVTLNTNTDGQLPDMASWLLHLHTVDETRYVSARVDLTNPQVSADAVLSRALLDLSIDDRFVITRPKAGQTPDDISQLARGYTERLNVFTHDLALNAAPESPYHIGVEGSARGDSDTSTLSAGVTTTTTSWSVATVGESLWTTNAADFPFNVRVDGEVVQVTTITGSSSPQTFTVVRSINGILKAHSSGAKVSLADPTYVGL